MKFTNVLRYCKHNSFPNKYLLLVTGGVFSAALAALVVVLLGTPVRQPAYTRASADIRLSASSTAGTNSQLSGSTTQQSAATTTNNSSATGTDSGTASSVQATESSGAAIAADTGSSLYAYPANTDSIDALAYANANPGSAGIMDKLASVPMAQWFGGWDASTVQSDVNTYVSAAASSGKMPVLVAYYIPDLDCGGYSSGGAPNASAYSAWMNSFVAGIGERKAIVILEPDALAGQDCLSASGQATRDQLLASAVTNLKNNTKASIYLDAGNPSWQPASTMAARLNAANIADATGFSLNVSNFYSTSQNIAYGDQISRLVGNKHFVIDTSRNGNGSPNGAWCNPSGVTFGPSPTLNTGQSLVDAYLWIKNPGQSDGTCGPNEYGTSAPAAGDWWPQYILMMANN